jgi:hypothetical protein
MPPDGLSAISHQLDASGAATGREACHLSSVICHLSSVIYFDSWDLQVEQRPFPWKDITESVDPQKMQVFSSFWRTIDEPSIEIVSWSPSRMLNNLRVSAGITIRPRSSILRAIPDSMRAAP